MRAALLALLLVAGCKREAAPDAGAPDPKRQFVADLTEAIRGELPDASVTYDAERDLVHVGGTQVYLGNMYSASQQSPEAREATLAHVVEIVSRAGRSLFPDAFDAGAGHLLLRVRDRASRTTALLAGGADAGPLAVIDRPLGTHLRSVLVYDSDTSVADVPRAQLEKWGVTEEQAFRVALANLAQTGPRFEKLGGAYAEHGGQNLAAARVLLTELIGRLSVKGRPVAFVCARDLLVVTGEKDTAGQQLALDACTSHEGGYPVSYRPLVLQRDGWATWQPWPGPVADRLAALLVQEARDVYSEQQDLLRAIHETTGEDIFVASVLVFRPRGGAEATLCTWTQDVRAYLPRTEYIGFVGNLPDGGLYARNARWDDAARVMGGAMKPLRDYEPPWFEIDAQTFPTAAQLDAMHAGPKR